MFTSASFVFRKTEISWNQNSGHWRLSRRSYKNFKSKRRRLWACWFKHQTI